MLTAVQEQLSEIRNIQGQIARSHEREKEMVADLERCRAEAVPLKEREAKVVQNLSSERGWRQVQGDKLGRELLALAKIVEEQTPNCYGLFTNGAESVPCGKIAGCGLAGCPVNS